MEPKYVYIYTLIVTVPAALLYVINIFNLSIKKVNKVMIIIPLKNTSYDVTSCDVKDYCVPQNGQIPEER